MKHVLRHHLLCLTLAILATSHVVASDLLPADTAIPDAVDHYIQKQLAADGIAPVSVASDQAILRRTTLDLAGRVPTQTEYDWYFSQAAEVRRGHLVDRLIDLPDFDYHQRNELDALLLYNKPYDNEFRTYLLTAMQQGRTWDSIFRDLILAEGKEGDEKGSVQYVLSRIREVDIRGRFGELVRCRHC